ncbi:MAG: putative bacteriocin export ABC transporter [Clostridiales bacterium]|nr:putative bacteriocin export ABC transporter [Clostridiales bacterium]
MSVRVENLDKKYGDKILFSDFNMKIEEGEMVAITGDSGKGKTTLLNIISGLERADKGNIYINEKLNPFHNKKDSIQLYREEISFLFQNYALISDITVEENIDIALKYISRFERREKKEAALKRVGLESKKKEKVYKLSGGEQQRVALARIMVKKSSIILADEPTGALDPTNRDGVISILKDFQKEGKSVLIVTHDPVVAKECQRIIQL